MMHKFALLMGFAAFVMADSKAWKGGVPRYAAKKGRVRQVPEKLLLRLQYPTQTSRAQSTTALERALQPSNPLAPTAPPRYLTATLSSGSAPLPLPKEELETLKALYNSLNGPNWNFKDNWMSASNPCGGGTGNNTWYGVQCTTFKSNNFSSQVTGLALPQNNLTGRLPHLRGLQHLLHLDISNPVSSEVTEIVNSVGGTLDALCGLSNLSTVLLTGNNINGSIPDCIQDLANVTVLNLGYNAIQGTTPIELCRLHKLEELLLRGNNLHGTVPICLGKDLTALRILDYTNANLDGGIGNQVLSGTLPVSLCDLEHLEALLFQGTQGLNGTIPNCLGAKQPQLQLLYLEINQFRGTLPEVLCQASTLEHLALYDNAMTGTLPSCLGSLSQLTLLELKKNQFHGPIPEELCQASALEWLLLYKNELTGSIPSCLGGLSQLFALDLDTNRFHGPIPEELCQASALEFLVLEDNTLTGTIPSCFGNLSQLIELELATNHFHGPIPEELCQASALENVLLCENALTGTLPSCLGSLSQLTELDLDTKRFHGPIPEELCQASALELLELYSNALTGSLPSCLATSFPLLEAMLLYNNYLTGALPSKWVLPSLISIMFSNNPKLSGSLPPSLFLQQSTSNVTENIRSSNVMLRAVVFEGTSIGETLPAAFVFGTTASDLSLQRQ
jgi:Leucine-rich repeat (LRR) protein